MNMSAIKNLFSIHSFARSCCSCELFGKINDVDECLAIILKKENGDAVNLSREEREDLWDIFCTVENALKAIGLIDGGNAFFHSAYCALCDSLGEYLEEEFFADDEYMEIFNAFLRARAKNLSDI